MDHGQHFGERGLFGHGISVYQELVRVPLVIKYPGTDRGEVVDQVVSGVDVLPTVLDVLGYGAPEGVHGVSLLDGGADRSVPVVTVKVELHLDGKKPDNVVPMRKTR